MLLNTSRVSQEFNPHVVGKFYTRYCTEGTILSPHYNWLFFRKYAYSEAAIHAKSMINTFYGIQYIQIAKKLAYKPVYTCTIHVHVYVMYYVSHVTIDQRVFSNSMACITSSFCCVFIKIVLLNKQIIQKILNCRVISSFIQQLSHTKTKSQLKHLWYGWCLSLP